MRYLALSPGSRRSEKAYKLKPLSLGSSRVLASGCQELKRVGAHALTPEKVGWQIMPRIGPHLNRSRVPHQRRGAHRREFVFDAPPASLGGAFIFSLQPLSDCPAALKSQEPGPQWKCDPSSADVPDHNRESASRVADAPPHMEGVFHERSRPSAPPDG